jgi:hypothetical protein
VDTDTPASEDALAGSAVPTGACAQGRGHIRGLRQKQASLRPGAHRCKICQQRRAIWRGRVHARVAVAARVGRVAQQMHAAQAACIHRRLRLLQRGKRRRTEAVSGKRGGARRARREKQRAQHHCTRAALAAEQ